jgi:hypothetical protein
MAGGKAHSVKTVPYALGANLAIAVAKTGAAIATSASATVSKAVQGRYRGRRQRAETRFINPHRSPLDQVGHTANLAIARIAGTASSVYATRPAITPFAGF